MSTGQKPTGLPGTVRPLDLVQSGGSLFQSAVFANGTAHPGLGALPTLDRIGGGVEFGAGNVVIQLDGPATTALAPCDGSRLVLAFEGRDTVDAFHDRLTQIRGQPDKSSRP